MDHIATVQGLDKLEFRMNNFIADGDDVTYGGVFTGVNPLPEMINQLKLSSDYDARQQEIATFNAVSML